VAKHEPEVRLANGKAYAELCNELVHRAPWTTGRTKDPGAGGLYQALELAQIAYEAHGLLYEPGLSKMKDPRRFRWLCLECGEADDPAGFSPRALDRPAVGGGRPVPPAATACPGSSMEAARMDFANQPSAQSPPKCRSGPATLSS